MPPDPIARFKELLHEAEQLGIHPFNAAAFATAGKDLQPTVRMLLLKEVDERGFVFYTNLESRKARQLDENLRASACFWWAQLKRQVRIEGPVEIVRPTNTSRAARAGARSAPGPRIRAAR